MRLLTKPLASLATVSLLLAAASTAAPKSTNRADILKAVEKALPLIERASAVALKERSCFTCHNGAATVFAVEAARQRGLRIDKPNMDAQLQRTNSDMRRTTLRWQPGGFLPGQSDAGGWKLLTLAEGGWKSDEMTDAAVGLLVDYDRNQGHWDNTASRLPTVGGAFTSTWAALAGMHRYVSPHNALGVELRTAEARAWLLRTPSKDTEDSVSKLRALKLAHALPKEIAEEAEKLLSNQRSDGGWAQTPGAKSDAYATSTALIGLYETNRLAHDAPDSIRAISYLLDTQRADGSWHVVKRARAVQPHFDSTFPHGNDQFISAVATSWASYAMLQTVPRMIENTYVDSLGGQVSEISADRSQRRFTASETGFFAERIKPLLEAKCYACHSESAQPPRADLRLDSRAHMLDGGANGPAILPEEPDSSLLMKAIRGDGMTRMPPVGDPLSDETVALFEQWIKVGAPHNR